MGQDEPLENLIGTIKNNLIYLLTHIFNRALKTGTIPDMKTGFYRPTSITNMFCKVMDRLITELIQADVGNLLHDLMVLSKVNPVCLTM